MNAKMSILFLLLIGQVLANNSTTSPVHNNWPLPDIWIIVVSVAVGVGITLIVALFIKCCCPHCCRCCKKRNEYGYAPPMYSANRGSNYV